MAGPRFGTDHSAFILSALRSRGKRVKKVKREILVQCLNPSHQDKHPSMSIRADGAVFICMSCGYKGNWQKLVKQFGFPPLPGSDQPHDTVLENQADLKGMMLDRPPLASVINANIKQPDNLKPWPGGDFRGFSEATLKRLGTQVWMDRGVQRVYWPFYMKGKVVGGSGRVHPEWEPKRQLDEDAATFKDRLKAWYRDEHPKYRNVYGISAKKILYPYDIYGPLDTVVLVEGQTSAIRLIDVGVDAMAILGVLNWSDTKRGLLRSKCVRNLVLLFDGDDAGRKLTEELIRELSSDFNVYALYLPDGVDPGDMDALWVNLVKRKFLKLAGKKPA